MFTAYTPLDHAIGRVVHVRTGGEEYTGMLVGLYRCQEVPMLVITPMAGGGVEHHIPLPGAVVQLKPEK